MSQDHEPVAHPPSLFRLGAIALEIGLTSFGVSPLPLFLQALVFKRGWLKESDFLIGSGLAQLLPGPITGNLAVFLGQRLLGLLGAVITLLALVTPGLLLTLILCPIYTQAVTLPIVAKLIHGMTLGMASILFGMVLRLLSKCRSTWQNWLLIGLTIVPILLFDQPAIVVVLPVLLLATWGYRWRWIT